MNVSCFNAAVYADHLIQAGDTEAFRNNQLDLPPVPFLYQLARRMILEGIATPVRGECLTEMLRLLLHDPRIQKDAGELFFRTLKMDQEYSSFKAVTFWNVIKEIAPASHILDPACFLSFLLHANSEPCGEEQQALVCTCVVELIASVDLRFISDLRLSINHPFFSIFYLRWERPDNQALLRECLCDFNRFQAENLGLMLQNADLKVPADYFSCVLIKQRFDLGVVLIKDPSVPISAPHKAFFIPPLSDEDLYIDEKVKHINRLLADLEANARLPMEIAEAYADALSESASDLSDSSEESSEPPLKKARLF